jgi:phage gp29-like protein
MSLAEKLRAARAAFNTPKLEPKKVGSFTIELRQPYRTQQDLSKWLTALKNAENTTSWTRKDLFDIYDMTILDDDFQTAWNKRKAALLNLNLVYDTGTKRTTEKASEFFKAPKFREFKSDVVDTIAWGFSLFEFSYKKGFDYILIPRRHVEPKRGDILVHDYDRTGVSFRIPTYKRTLLEYGRTDDLGLLLAISIPVIYKRNSMGDWADYSELAGTNFRQVSYNGSDTNVRSGVKMALENAGSNGLIELPKGVTVDWLTNSSASSNELFENFNATMSNSILKLILGQSLTTNDQGTGSLAKARVALEVERSVFDNDKVMFLDFLNYKLRTYLPFWGISDAGTFTFIEDDKMTVKEKLENDKLLADILKVGTLPVEDLGVKYGWKLEEPEPVDIVIIEKPIEEQPITEPIEE